MDTEQIKRQKARARQAVCRALREGTLVKGPCRVCGRTDKVHAHHSNYDLPLSVRWLCVVCHAQEHKRIHTRPHVEKCDVTSKKAVKRNDKNKSLDKKKVTRVWMGHYWAYMREPM